jgi:carboxymethylenebutenolidase
MGSYGAEDQGIPAELVNEFRDALDAQGTPNDIKLYEGAGHSFFNSGPAHHEASAQDSWRRSVAWFTEHLAG